MKPTKTIYSNNYWIEQLIAAGKALEPDKYTEQHCDLIRKRWRWQPITKLHLMVVNRRTQLNEKQQTINAAP